MDAESFRKILARKTKYEMALQEIVATWEKHKDTKPCTALLFYLIAKAALPHHRRTKKPVVSSAQGQPSSGAL